MNEFDPTDGDDDDEETARPPGHRPSRSGIVNLGINVGIQSLTDLLGVLDARSSPRSIDGESDDEAARGDPEAWPLDAASEPAAEAAKDYLVDTYRTEDEYVVTAELPGVSEEDLAVGIDVRTNDLVIAADGRPIERVPLPWSSTVAAKVWFNNGILEVRLEPDDAGGSEDQDGGTS